MKKSYQGMQSYLVGQSAELRVSDHYRARGYRPVAARWRGSRGEIDLIARKDGILVFIEVKSAKSHDRALQSLSLAQQNRILLTAQEYLASETEFENTDIRFDVSTVPHSGDIQILENALVA